MNDILFLHWRYREIEAQEARKQMERERRAKLNAQVKRVCMIGCCVLAALVMWAY